MEDRELEEFIVGTSTMPVDDWGRAYLAGYLLTVLYNHRVAFFVLCYLHHTHGCVITDVVEFILKKWRTDPAGYPQLFKGIDHLDKQHQLILDGDSFVFQSSKGITRIPQAGGEAKLITSSGTSPFHKVAANETDLYIIAEDAYANSGSLERVPLAGGKPKTLTAWRIRGDLGSGIDRIAADDQCVYYAKTHTDFTSIIARIK
jgi:hypothetical protein